MPKVSLSRVDVPCGDQHTIPAISVYGVRTPGLGPMGYAKSDRLVGCKGDGPSFLISDVAYQECFERSGRECDPTQNIPLLEGALANGLRRLLREDSDRDPRANSAILNTLRRLDPTWDGIQFRWEDN